MHAAPHAEWSCVKGRPEAVDGVENPNPRPDPRILKKNPSESVRLQDFEIRNNTIYICHYFKQLMITS